MQFCWWAYQGKNAGFAQFDLPSDWAWQRATWRSNLVPLEYIGCYTVIVVPLVCLLQLAPMV